MPLYIEEPDPQHLANTQARVYRRQCRICGDTFDSLVHYFASCGACREGRTVDSKYKTVLVVHVTFVPASKVHRRKAQPNNASSDRSQPRCSPDLPIVRELLERCVTMAGSTGRLEAELGLSEHAIRNYLQKGYMVPVGVIDECLCRVGEPWRYDEFVAVSGRAAGAPDSPLGR